ncbi:hypothetical protein CRG98_039898 [Punica granatum]|uniref:AMP-dependent synthetase/ligase domain-containing protein n=1 Tax=Punica granatum TaxID=22663 RepID=A0A2I0I6W5_PUNGR|nr:hypothetical protein CRG98_039898 [Punica granatum]
MNLSQNSALLLTPQPSLPYHKINFLAQVSNALAPVMPTLHVTSQATNELSPKILGVFEILRLADSLAFHLRAHFSLSKGDATFILVLPSLNVPIIYLSFGMVVSPANPLNFDSDIAHHVHISNPSIAFATSWTTSKLPLKLRLGVILVDSPEFDPCWLTEIGKQPRFTTRAR